MEYLFTEVYSQLSPQSADTFRVSPSWSAFVVRCAEQFACRLMKDRYANLAAAILLPG
jgi:hypothetical protein